MLSAWRMQAVRFVSESRLSVYGAIVANAAIALTKFIAAAIVGSSALFSEGIHSVVDTGDGLLLLLGIHLSKRPATKRHPYGHGAETYFWSMVVAMSIFGMGGGVSIYEGIHHLFEPRAPSGLVISLCVLGAAALFEGISWALARHTFRRHRGQQPVWQAIQSSKDPTTFVVLLEDSAALLGILLAATGITLAHVLGLPVFDAAASIMIGLLLLVVGIILGRETWSLLVGESASDELVRSVQCIARAQRGVADARSPRTLHLGPELVHVDIDVLVEDGHAADEVARQIEAAVTAEHPTIHRVSLRFPDASVFRAV